MTSKANEKSTLRLLSTLGVFVAVTVVAPVAYLTSAEVAEEHLRRLGAVIRFEGPTQICTSVRLDHCQIIDDDLRRIRKLDPRFGIYLKGTQVTDAGLLYLQGLSFYELDLTDTQVTEAGVTKLKKTIGNPTAEIIR